MMTGRKIIFLWGYIETMLGVGTVVVCFQFLAHKIQLVLVDAVGVPVIYLVGRVF